MRIYLLGFMGSGKTTFGKKLAASIRFSFIDTDACFEKEYQTTIEEFLKTHTEDEFRQLETKILQQTKDIDKVVIALGGGTPCFYDNMNWILENGLCVYLKLSPMALKNRLLNSQKKRPLLNYSSEEKLLSSIENLLVEREKFYQRAHISIDANNIKSNSVKESFRLILESKKKKDSSVKSFIVYQ
ncbi:MAG TPA: shikimate kinase [Bacteroidales bacterium]|nr:shikimate kinase [Bacteroidales bacterium]